MHYWKKLTTTERQKRIQQALSENVDFSNDISLGYPASKLDGRVFNDDAPFLKDAYTLQTFVANPNHIGCHTYGSSEHAFKGTQDIEREVLNVVAVDIFKATPESFDGYVAPGGTEANIQAIWIYRNHYIKNYGARLDEIVILASEDTHYSIPKASNLMMVDWISVPVDFHERTIDKNTLEQLIIQAKADGRKYFIVVANMGTTMFGSVDDPDSYTSALEKHDVQYQLHVDAAYGGFVYPFSKTGHALDFSNPKVNSITIDAHKMLQAPYGTGIFLCRKGWIEHVLTKEAEYVEGMDLTLCGSRSGSNAVAIWMILFTYGENGWFEKISILQMRTAWLCKELDLLGVTYFRERAMNIVTISAAYISDDLATSFHLVPQKHDTGNEWYKVIIMDHVEVTHLQLLVSALKLRIEDTAFTAFS
ncbi:Pyridoxal phosphate-dependent amino acid decarboxylase [Pedobacter sp. BAL39]|uniref:pyridoxal phosphate-dependent decarboxylase family protein n=1 Tax=Pedobacter sp. BAL39 TaxID=391596 RepID=UPI000155A178|nr:pyridoxal-dependent decarboxylase [Pedobacter sp. BAL39]EDM34943.1 Pyridoxal phosphate-dependent amino acid decarboxylase [Pedobacter sp. BAL39]